MAQPPILEATILEPLPTSEPPHNMRIWYKNIPDSIKHRFKRHRSYLVLYDVIKIFWNGMLIEVNQGLIHNGTSYPVGLKKLRKPYMDYVNAPHDGGYRGLAVWPQAQGESVDHKLNRKMWDWFYRDVLISLGHGVGKSKVDYRALRIVGGLHYDPDPNPTEGLLKITKTGG